MLLLLLLSQITERVSLTPAGGQIVTASSYAESLSSDGRYALFSTTASLVPADTNNRQDLYVRDRIAGTTTLVSVNSSGAVGNDSSLNGRISDDGRFVVFDSQSTNLIVPDANGISPDVFLHDRQTGLTTLVSRSSAGVQGNSGSMRPSISADGRWIAFESGASNLVSGDGIGVQDVFLHDALTGATLRMSFGVGGEGNAPSYRPEVSGDGKFVCFDTAANNLVANDTNAFSDVLRYDRTLGTLLLVSANTSGVASSTSGSDSPSVSADGRYVAFSSGASDLVAGDTNGLLDVFRRDVLAGTTLRVSVDQGGAQLTAGLTAWPVISGDGNRVAFGSSANNLVPGDVNGYYDIFMRDVAAASNLLLSVSTAGAQANEDCWYPAISADGLHVAFDSNSSNLVSGDTNGWGDAFLRTLAAPGPSLAKTGACPGAITLTVSGATPGGQLAVLRGPAGTFVKPTPPCAGLTLAISPPSLAAMVNANGTGGATLNFTAPGGACGLTVQIVDVASCTPTNPVTL